jgi:hypothetical protein
MGANETASPSCPLVHSGHGSSAPLSGTVALGVAHALTNAASPIVSATLIVGFDDGL